MHVWYSIGRDVYFGGYDVIGNDDSVKRASSDEKDKSEAYGSNY